MHKGFGFAMGAALLLASPACAQQMQRTPIELPEGRDFRHAHSGIALPPTLDGIPRRTAVQLIEDQLDVSFNYESDDETELVTVYLYRMPVGTMPLWFDYASRIATLSTHNGRTSFAGAPAAFALPRQQVASVLAVAFEIDGSKGYRSSALAMASLGEWLVKVRYSSKTADAPATRARIETITRAIGWPSQMAGLSVAEPIADCTTPLAIKPDAKPIDESREDRIQRAVMGGLLGRIAAEEQPKAVTTRWCRRDAVANFGLFSLEDSGDDYLLTLSDAGVALRVDRGIGDLQTLIAKAQNDQQPTSSWQVGLYLPQRIVQFQSFDGLPPVDAALASLDTEPVAATTTWGDERKVSISTGNAEE